MLEMLFRTSSKGFLCVFSHNDKKDGVACIKTEPFKAWFCGFFYCGLRLASRWVGFLKKAQNDKCLVILNFAEQSEVSQSPCHTELSQESEVSINSKCALNSVDFSLCANARRSK